MTDGNASSLRAKLRLDRRIYLVGAILLLLVEISIALFVKSGFVRHTLGDVLIVMLLYCALMAVTNLRPVTAAAASTGLAFLVEAAQALDIVERLGLSHAPLARIVIGTTFSPWDLAAYAAGGALALASDKIIGGAARNRVKGRTS